jgi:glycosyltransferase involved in cell wall biosynthesis
LAFGPTGETDVKIGLGERWEDAARRFPRGWSPDFIALTPAYAVVPPAIWTAPVPIVVFAVDWNLLWHQYRALVPHCELVLTDGAGVRAVTAEFATPALPLLLYGCGLDDCETGPETVRDLDVVFVGNLNPNVQAERMPWLARLCRLPNRRVLIRTGVHGAPYRALLRRARIVFNRSIRGECNMRVFEATAAGALLFQEAENLETPAVFADRQECVYYRDDNLEFLLDHYLDNESERLAIAAAARARVAEFRHDRIIAKFFETLDLDALRARRAARKTTPGPNYRGLELLALPPGRRNDPELTAPLRSSIPNPVADYLLGLVSSPEAAVGLLSRAGAAEPNWIACGLALAEAQAMAGQLPEAVTTARELLERRIDEEAPHLMTTASSYPMQFDAFRVEWEKAGWMHAGHAARELQVKRRLLLWRLHDRLAAWTGSLDSAQQAAAQMPQIGVAQATLGQALLRKGHYAEASPHFRVAASADPFNPFLKDSLIQALRNSGDGVSAAAVSQEWKTIESSCPDIVRRSSSFGNAPPTVPARRHRIVWEGSIRSLHSFAHVNREICTRLVARGHDVILHPIERTGSAGALRLSSDLGACVHKAPNGPIDVWVRHRWPPDLTVPRHGRFVLMQPWEYGSLPTAWVTAAREHAAEVWAYSRAMQKCYIAAGVAPDRVPIVPLGVDSIAFHPRVPPLPLPTRKSFRFLFVGGTIHRKGFDLLLAAYRRGFSASDDVCLVVHDIGGNSFYSNQKSDEVVAAFRAHNGAPELLFLTEPLPPDQLPGLYTACDCLVLPFRGEGFGLPIAEAMACGRPVVVTDDSPARDYTDHSTGYLIPAVRRELAVNRIDSFETIARPWLLEPDLDYLTKTLQTVAHDTKTAREKGRAAAERIHSGWTWEHTVRAVEERLERIVG